MVGPELEGLPHEQVLGAEVPEQPSVLVLNERVGEQRGLVADVLVVREEQVRVQVMRGESWTPHYLDEHVQHAVEQAEEVSFSLRQAEQAVEGEQPSCQAVRSARPLRTS